MYYFVFFKSMKPIRLKKKIKIVGHGWECPNMLLEVFDDCRIGVGIGIRAS